MDPQQPHTTTATTTTTTTPTCSNLSLVRRLTWTIILLFLSLTAIIGIAWSVMDPHEPRFRISSISVSNFSVSDLELRGTFEVELNITNPNKKVEMMVDRFYVSMFHGSVELSRAIVLQPIYLNKISNKDVKIKFSIRNSSTKLVDKVVSRELVNNWNKGIVNFDVKMLARIVFEAGIWPSREKFLDIYCGNLDVGFVPIKDTGKLLGIGKDCQAER